MALPADGVQGIIHKASSCHMALPSPWNQIKAGSSLRALGWARILYFFYSGVHILALSGMCHEVFPQCCGNGYDCGRVAVLCLSWTDQEVAGSS